MSCILNNYNRIHPIMDDSQLAGMFNNIIRKCNFVRICTTPRYFEDVMSEDGFQNAFAYSLTILIEKWMHCTVCRLRNWEKKLDLYLWEYAASWRFYACSRRLDFIREHGGDEEDYNEKGELITENLPDEKLEGFTILSALVMDSRDIVQDTTPEQLKPLEEFMQADANTTPLDFFKGDSDVVVKAYKPVFDEDGDIEGMVQVSDEEMELSKISKSVDSKDLFAMATEVCQRINSMMAFVNSLNCFKDNKDELVLLRTQVASLLNLDFSAEKKEQII